MKKLLAAVVLGIALLFGTGVQQGYVKAETTVESECNCPAEDIIIKIQNGMETWFVPIPKGAFCDKEGYMTEEEYNNFMKEMEKNKQPLTNKEKLNKGGI